MGEHGAADAQSVNTPGDKLLKLQVAGIPNIEMRRSLQREMADHYRQVGVRESVANKYLTPVLAFVLCVAACWRVSSAGTVGLVAFQSAAVVYLYKDIPIGAPQPLFDGGGLAMVALAVLSLAASVVVLVAGFAQRLTNEFHATRWSAGHTPRSRA